MLAELIKEAGLPDGVMQVINGDKGSVDAILDNETIQAVGFVGSTPIAQYIYERAAANGKRVQCFGGAKNHMIIMPDADMNLAADALIGAGYGAAGERCMAISVAVPVGDETADRLIEALVPRIEKLKVGPYTAGNDVDYGPVVTKAAKENILRLITSGVDQGATLVTDGRNFSLQGYEDGFFVGPTLFDNVTTDMDIYRQEIFGPVLSTVRAKSYEEAVATPWTTNMATAPRSSPAMATPRAISPAGSTSAWSVSTCRSRFRWPTTPSAAGKKIRLRRSQPTRR